MVSNNSGNPLVRAAVRTVLAGGALAATFGVAAAQESPTPPAPATGGSQQQLQLQEVVVTGSRIATPNQVAMSPVTFVSAQAIAQTGVTRVEDMLNQLPQVFASQGSNIVNGSDETATINLRGLQAKRTLVLIDGQRMTPGDPRTGGAADVNMIPTALISSVEIQTGGASSIYGADAVAGVVNFKLNDHFQGVKIVVDGGIYQHDNSNTQGVQDAITAFNTTYGTNFAQAPSSVWTGAQKEISFIAGLNTPDGNGNATFFATYRNVAAVLQSQYSISACTLGSGYTGGSYDTGGKFTCIGSSNGYPGRFISLNPASTLHNSMLQLGPNGPTGTLVPFNRSELFNFGPINYFQRPDERYTAGAFLHYTINEHATVYANTMFMDDRSIAQIAPSAAFLGSVYTVNCDNPFLSASEVNNWCAGGVTNASLLIGRRNIEGGPRIDDVEHTDFREVVGLKGGIGNAWTYDANFQYGFSNLNETFLNDLSYTKINYALDVVNTANGPECAVTAQGITNGLAAGCIPWNIFGNGGSAYMAPGAATSYLNTPGVQRGQIAQSIAELDLTGDLGQYGIALPTANSGLKVAVGADYRDDKSFTQPDEEFQSADLTGQGGAILPVAGDVITREIYGEARLPLMDDKPFAKAIDLDASYRFSSYSPFNGATKGFDTNTFAFSADWKPTDDYRLRASFSRAVRAPNVGELYSPQSVALDGNSDPCAGAAPAFTAAQCARTGVTNYGSVPTAPAAQYNGLTGGNPDLRPETALTTSFGIAWTPSYVPNLRLQVDYYDIKIDDVIKSIGYTTIITQCATANLFCDLIHRDTRPGLVGALWTPQGFVIDTLANVGTLEEKGLDIDAGYGLALNGLGRLQFSLVGTYITNYDTTALSAVPTTKANCAGYYGPTCSAFGSGAGEPVWKWRHTLRVSWMTPWHGVDVSAAWRYFSPVNLEFLSPNANLSNGGSVAAGTISSTDAHFPSMSYLDLTASAQLRDNLSLRVGVNNVLDKDPPLVGLTDLPSTSGNGNTFPQAYDSLGRYLFAELSIQF
ncbi:MAG: TonB-dependent receptor [Gammaproteobacteria bacterium]|nr:TonB-dependent receptor [Gammaproteobacteria bacterium]